MNHAFLSLNEPIVDGTLIFPLKNRHICFCIDIDEKIDARIAFFLTLEAFLGTEAVPKDLSSDKTFTFCIIDDATL